MVPVRDRFDRPLGSLRISVTDRCNIRCGYCMPEADYVWLPRATLLTFEEIDRLAGVFATLGADRIRLTGGEPLLRRDLPVLIATLAGRPELREIAMTTNGVLLAPVAGALRAAGLSRVTVSLDTLRPDRFVHLTRFDEHARVLEGIDAAHRTFGTLKVDMVVMAGLNDDELVPMIEFGRSVEAEVRFIEYMDVGGATRWSMDQVVPRTAMLDRLSRHFGRVEPVNEVSAAPADRYRLADGTVFGIISSTTQPFCRTCDRARLTADGTWLTCLYQATGLDLREPLRAGASDEDLRTLIAARWQARDDRGAERRLAVAERTALLPVSALRRDAHREMHTRGG
jgi:cyclic pyranopterin phosphate synthase